MPIASASTSDCNAETAGNGHGAMSETRPPPLQNATAASKSPYVRSQNGEIAWQLLGDGAIARAKADDKLVFLHIGYSASHYCRLTMQESFSNRRIVGLLNKHFVPVIVDREERPDLDSIFTSYISSICSIAGHPLNVFLTPDMEPVFGGTYFPGPGTQLRVAERADEPADFLLILERLVELWCKKEYAIRVDGRRAVVELRKMLSEGATGTSTLSGDLDIDQLEEAYAHLSRTFDHTYGGFVHMPMTASPTFPSGQVDLNQLQQAYKRVQKTPKFPTPAKLSFLLRATRFPQEVLDVVGQDLCASVSTFALKVLRQMAAGGIHDQVGGSFHRCSTTRDWALPTFEKMMADNALLLGLYLDAWLLQGGGADGEFYDTVCELAEYLTSPPMMLQTGGFITSESADACDTMQQGTYYLWTRREFETAIGDSRETEIAAAHWDVHEHGNVDSEHDPTDEYVNQNVLRRVRSPSELSDQFGIGLADVQRLLRSARAKLKAYRDCRARPTIDGKIVTAYNGMAIGALARTAAAFMTMDGGSLAGQRYLAAATNAAHFIRTELWHGPTKTLYRMHCGERAETEAFAEDYAFLIEGVLDLLETTADEGWLQWADELQARQTQLFYDYPAAGDAGDGSAAGCGAFYTSSQDARHLLTRVKDAMDTSQPSANAVSASNLFRLGALLDDDGYTVQAKETVNAFEPEILQYPYLFPGLLGSLVAWRLGGRRWVSVGRAATAATDDPIKMYYRAPRGGLWTLLHAPADPGRSFLAGRSPALASLLAEAEPGVYSLEPAADGAGGLQLRPLGQEDLAQASTQDVASWGRAPQPTD